MEERDEAAALDEALAHEMSEAAAITPPDEEPYTSPLLDRMDDRPATVCVHCVHSMWSKSRHDLRCYCRLMYAVVWSNREPTNLIECDGHLLQQQP